MAWIYLVESEGSASHSGSGSDPLPTVRSSDTLNPFCFHECGMDSCFELLSGMTCPRFQANLLKGKSTSCMGDSHARTLAVQDLESVWTARAADFSLSSSDALAIYDQDSFSWKTCQLSLLEDLNAFSWSSLRWGMIRAGRLYQPPNLEPVTEEIDGSSLPTPTAREGGTNKSASAGATVRPQLSKLAKTLPTPMARDWKGSGGANRHSRGLCHSVGGSLNPLFVEEIMGYETGWTESADWAMQWYRGKREKRSCG